MLYYKITNFMQTGGNPDYKGLDRNLFIAGMQLYPKNLVINNYCGIASSENIPNNVDLQQITEEEYKILKQQVDSTYSTSQPSIEERTTAIEIALANMMGGVS